MCCTSANIYVKLQMKRNRTTLDNKYMLKSVDTTLQGTAGVASQIDSLPILKIGTEIYNRVGRSVLVTGIHLRGVLKTNGATNYRVLLVYDNHGGSVPPVISDILQDSDNSGGVTNDYLCGLNSANQFRFQILYDRMYLNPFGGGNDSYNSRQVIDDFVRLDHEQIYTNNLSGALSDICSGALYHVIIVTPGQTVLSTNYLCHVRMEFADV